MHTALSAEIRKLLSTRTWWALLLAGTGLCLLTSYGYVVSDRNASVSAASQSITSDVVRSWMMLFLFASILAALAISREYGAGTMARTVLLVGSRNRVLAAKTAVTLLIGVGFGLVAALGAVLTPFLIMPPLGVQVSWSTDATRTTIGVFACGVLAAAWGGFIGWLLRNSTGAICAVIVLTLLVDPGVQRLAPGVAKYLFSIALSSIYRDVKTDLLPLWPAVAVAFGWLAVTGLLARRHLLRSDVH